MSDDDWNDESRDSLREVLREAVRGEVRLRRKDPDQIAADLRDRIEDEAPEGEWGGFSDYARTEVARASEQLAAEQVSWPDRTDCDRLDAAQATMLENGIVFWQASPCCDNCTLAELSDHIDDLERQRPGTRERVKGYAFFHDQHLPEQLAASADLHVFVGYGWSRADDDTSQQTYEREATTIGHEVVGHLREAGLRVDWNGDLSRKIDLSVVWQRR